MKYIAGKTVLITGASKGIGLALAQQCLQAGAKVVVWGQNRPALSDEHLHFCTCDVSQELQVKAALEQTLHWTDRIDFLINNAGFGYFAPIERFDSQQFVRMFEVNVFGTFYVTQAVAPHMQAQQQGHILNVSSIAGKVGMAQGEGYNATKFAVTGLSDCLFQELRTAGIKVTTVFPGSTATHFFDAIPGFSASPMMMDPQEVAQMMLHAMNTSPNFLVREIEMRPLRSK
jgi:NAD(P)-dependent dehydrogenase (short-subunit alcohol dehydrogenase family)